MWHGRHLKGRMRTGWLLLLVAGASSLTHRARACSPAYCAEARVSPPEGTTVPANVPALVVVAARGRTGVEAYLPPSGIQLADTTGAMVGTEIVLLGDGARTYLVKPRSTLVPNHDYTLRFPNVDCSGSSDGGLEPRVFRAAEPSDVPQHIGDVGTIVHTLAEEEVSTASGSCTSPALVSAATVAVKPSPELDAYLGVTAFISHLDGDTRAYPPWFSAERAQGQPLEFRYATTCRSDDQGVDPGIGAGHHTVRLEAVVAGAATQPPFLEFDFELSCTASGGGCAVARPGTTLGRPSTFGGVAAFLSILLARRASRTSSHRRGGPA